ncbi:hypothetical protein [Actinoplanes sp. NPDC026619]|uniref:hypothetical protein n=1 Tax=Actinoplanes sp. NPDC026619 TaxID=3155798 RepID=UPI0033FAD495
MSARLELDRLLAGDALAREILGLVAAAERPVGVDELVRLTGRAPWEVDGALSGAAGRTLVVSPEGAYVSFGHETLLETARAHLGPLLLAGFRKRLDS